MKKCSRCGETKSKTEFHKESRAKSGLSGHCKSCASIRCKASYVERKKQGKYQLKNQPRLTTEIQRHKDNMSSLYSYYRLRETDFQDLMNAQKGCCAICGKDFGDLKYRAIVDHNHKTLQIRSLLCKECNVLLGHAKENQDILLNAVTYLAEHEHEYKHGNFKKGRRLCRART